MISKSREDAASNTDCFCLQESAHTNSRQQRNRRNRNKFFGINHRCLAREPLSGYILQTAASKGRPLRVNNRDWVFDKYSIRTTLLYPSFCGKTRPPKNVKNPPNHNVAPSKQAAWAQNGLRCTG